MNRDEKLLERLRRRPAIADFSDVERLLLTEGWKRARQKGSHVSFTKPGNRSITVFLIGGRKVKGVYIDQILTRLELDE